MTLWFGPLAGLPPDYGYFHLCPACFRRCVQPRLELVRGQLMELHPEARDLLAREREREQHA